MRHVAFSALLLCAGIAVMPMDAQARSCADFSAGLAVFSNVKAKKVSCKKARHLLKKTTLSENRKGRTEWTYKHYRWTFRTINELVARVKGRRGQRLVKARFSVS